MDSGEAKATKLLAVASGGGHWEQLMLLGPVFERYDTLFVTTDAKLPQREGIEKYRTLRDSNRSDLFAAARTVIDAFRIVQEFRPDVILTTGAFPGLACLMAGRTTGARTIWLDSIANCDALSGSGRLARHFSSLWLTQWEPLAAGKPMLRYYGSLL